MKSEIDTVESRSIERSYSSRRENPTIDYRGEIRLNRRLPEKHLELYPPGTDIMIAKAEAILCLDSLMSYLNSIMPDIDNMWRILPPEIDLDSHIPRKNRKKSNYLSVYRSDDWGELANIIYVFSRKTRLHITRVTGSQKLDQKVLTQSRINIRHFLDYLGLKIGDKVETVGCDCVLESGGTEREYRWIEIWRPYDLEQWLQEEGWEIYEKVHKMIISGTPSQPR